MALDTNFFYRKLLSSETSDKKKLAFIVHERFLKMKMDRDKIKERYLGPEKDIERFFNATDAFHKALLKGLSYSPSHSRKEILSYLDANVEPAYIEVEDSLKTIIAFCQRARCARLKSSLPLPSTRRRPVPFSSSSLS